MFKHNIYGDQLEGQDCMPDSPNLLSPECFTGLWCPPVLASFEDTGAEEHRREVAKESGRGVTLGDLNEYSLFL